MGTTKQQRLTATHRNFPALLQVTTVWRAPDTRSQNLQDGAADLLLLRALANSGRAITLAGPRMPPQKELTMHSISSIRFAVFGLMVGLILVFCTQSFAQ